MTPEQEKRLRTFANEPLGAVAGDVRALFDEIDAQRERIVELERLLRDALAYVDNASGQNVESELLGKRIRHALKGKR